MNDIEYRITLDLVVAAARTVLTVDVDGALAAIAKIHAIGPVLDPTAYRGGLANLADAERLLRSASAFRKVAASFEPVAAVFEGVSDHE